MNRTDITISITIFLAVLGFFVNVTLLEIRDAKSRARVYSDLLDDTRERWVRLYGAISEALAVAEEDWPRALEILQEAIQ